MISNSFRVYVYNVRKIFLNVSRYCLYCKKIYWMCWYVIVKCPWPICSTSETESTTIYTQTFRRRNTYITYITFSLTAYPIQKCRSDTLCARLYTRGMSLNDKRWKKKKKFLCLYMYRERECESHFSQMFPTLLIIFLNISNHQINTLSFLTNNKENFHHWKNK